MNKSVMIQSAVCPASSSPCGARRGRLQRHARSQLTKALKCFIRTHLPAALAIAAFGLVGPVAAAATVNAVFNSASDVPVTASGYTATGNTVNFILNFAPATGTELMVVSNTAQGFIQGTFDNLAHGQSVALNCGGVTYNFVANYYGGSGNDLVLAWRENRALACGDNYYGQLGDNSASNYRLLPVPTTATGVLTGKTVVAMSAGGGGSLALCSDGTLAAWGYNGYGQLGDNSMTDRHAPVAVNKAAGVSALNGKTLAAIAAGGYHCLALCSDGTVAAWGRNDYGELGDNSTTSRLVPVAVNTNSGVSALYGKTVVAIAAGWGHSLALCSDGTIAAWGYNYSGQLGDNTTTRRLVPVAVSTNSGVSALFGKTVVAIATGANHNLALCSDGTLAAWGLNDSGQVGDGATTNRLVPVVVNTNSGVSALCGKTVAAIAAGGYHSLALCSDGAVAAWGYNGFGQLGDNTTTNRLVPVTVNTNSGVSALYAKTVVAIATGTWHNLARCLDGTVAAWGHNAFGQLGDNTKTNRSVPATVSTSPLNAGECFTLAASGSFANHTLALVAAPPAPRIALTGVRKLINGPFEFAFTNTPGALFVVVAATNSALPLGNWTALTGLTEVSSGQFKFTDPAATNGVRRFYRVRWP